MPTGRVEFELELPTILRFVTLITYSTRNGRECTPLSMDIPARRFKGRSVIDCCRKASISCDLLYQVVDGGDIPKHYR